MIFQSILVSVIVNGFHKVHEDRNCKVCMSWGVGCRETGFLLEGAGTSVLRGLACHRKSQWYKLNLWLCWTVYFYQQYFHVSIDFSHFDGAFTCVFAAVTKSSRSESVFLSPVLPPSARSLHLTWSKMCMTTQAPLVRALHCPLGVKTSLSLGFHPLPAPSDHLLLLLSPWAFAEHTFCPF